MVYLACHDRKKFRFSQVPMSIGLLEYVVYRIIGVRCLSSHCSMLSFELLKYVVHWIILQVRCLLSYRSALSIELSECVVSTFLDYWYQIIISITLYLVYITEKRLISLKKIT